jgi:hypothetical protein
VFEVDPEDGFTPVPCAHGVAPEELENEPELKADRLPRATTFGAGIDLHPPCFIHQRQRHGFEFGQFEAVARVPLVVHRDGTRQLIEEAIKLGVPGVARAFGQLFEGDCGIQRRR